MSVSQPRLIFLGPLLFLLGVFVARLPATVSRLTGFGVDFIEPISEVQRLLESSYVNEPDVKSLQRGAIDGMLQALDDPYAEYIPPTERADFEKDLLGRFSGIGAQVQIDAGLPTIVTPLEDSPAFRAGILPGDKIVEIDGKPTTGESIDAVVARLTGEAGTKVSIVILRGEERLPFTLVREQIVVRTVQGVSRRPDGTWDFMLDHDRRIGYIRLAQFIPSAAEELAGALKSIGAPEGSLNGLILDLRNNPGGDLDACLEIADMFLRQGVIVSVRGRNGPDQSYASNPRGTLPDFPLVVLVNGFSASASEIVAGSLADHGRATIVGTRTFGKGLVQTVRHLRSVPEAYVKFTVQRYELPSGRVIQRTDDSTTWGVDPTPGFYIPMTDEEQIAALTKRRELDILRNGTGASATAEAAPAPRWTDPAWIESDVKDKQLAAALRAMELRLASGAWTPLTDRTQQAAQVSADELRNLDLMHQRMLRAIAEVEKRMTTLESTLAGSTPATTEVDLWADELDLVNGAVEVFDKERRKVAELKITGPELERWLLLADIEPVGTAEDAPDATPGEKTP